MNKLKFFQITLIVGVLSLTVSLLWFIGSAVKQYDQVNSSWAQYSQNESRIVDTLLKLNADLGYGGMIHNFKNYVIRGDEKYLQLFNQDVLKIRSSLLLLGELHDQGAEKHEFKHESLLQEINLTVVEYSKQINIVQNMHKSNRPIINIDDFVKVNDTVALRALSSLRKAIDERSLRVQKETSIALNNSHGFLSNGQFFALPLIALMILLIYYIHQIRKSNEEILKAHEWVDTLLDTAPEATICSNYRGEIVRVNHQAENLFGYSEQEFLELNIDQLVPDQFSASHHAKRAAYYESSKVRSMNEGVQLFAKLKSGEQMEVGINLSMAGSGLEKIVIATVRDVTELRKAQEKLIYQASHDALTGLMNRSAFESELESIVLQTSRYKEHHVLCFLDLDQFKVINDTSGHAAGDAMLVNLAALLNSHLRETDILARLGGDEFGVLMKNCSVEQAHTKANEIISLIEDFRFPWDNNNFTIGVSIGICAIDRGASSKNILKYSDIACYAAKDAGRNRAHIYQEDDEKLMLQKDQVQWVNRIKEALENNYFCLYAQEIRPTDSAMSYANYEVLIRLQEKDGEIIPPGAFLPTAERYNLITKIDLWVIDNVFRWLTEHASSFSEKTHFSINLSGRSMGDDEVLQRIIDWLDAGTVPASKIYFEVTETMAIANLNEANNFIFIIKGRGCGFSLDDFGSGLSSFGYLKNLNVDTLKIDGVFVRDIIDDPIDEAMVESINHIGHVMNMETIAEFVENDEISERLIAMGVDYLQGYGIARPVPINDLLLK